MADHQSLQNDLLAESTDILAAAQNLMQLSDEFNNNNNDNGVDVDVDVTGGKRKERISGEEEVDQRPKINEIEVIVAPPKNKKKKKKYRSVESIYRVTRPIIA